MSLAKRSKIVKILRRWTTNVVILMAIACGCIWLLMFHYINDGGKFINPIQEKEFEIYEEFIDDDPPTTPKQEEQNRQQNAKYILFWDAFFDQKNWHFDADTSDHEVLETMGCEVTNCVFTSNNSMMPIEQFDALLFHTNALGGLPGKRLPKQIYIAATMESPSNSIIISGSYKNTFNWTSNFTERQIIWIDFS
jgi:hypothetical protein